MTAGLKRRGARTVVFETPPRIISTASIVGDVEGAGPLGKGFDMILEDDTWGESSFEHAERKMLERAVRMALEKLSWPVERLQCLLGGDLLNQLITSNYAARELRVPFLGLYGACSATTESLLLASMMMDGGFLENAACSACSHFSTAERQFRGPLEMGAISAPTAQRTVTGAGVVLLQDGRLEPPERGALEGPPVLVRCGTIGRVIDMGIADITNMGAAMAPAAADTIVTHMRDSGRDITDYDAIITGDLGAFGSEMLLELCKDEGIDLQERHLDCGNLIYSEEQKKGNSGASGCGCSAVVLTGHILPLLQRGPWQRILFLATGALMSTTSSQQGDSIPGIAHAVVLERGAE